MKKIAVLASGEGTNFQALLDASRSGRIPGAVVLLVSSKKGAGVLRRAQAAGVESLLIPASDFKSADDHAAAIASACLDRGVDLICLAGFMVKVGAPLLKAFPWRIMNVHPSLLPAFGGKGFYGDAPHRAVIESGARVSGCTVHFIDEDYDRGKIILQEAVPVFEADDDKSLAERVRRLERRLYPLAVRLFCEDRLRIAEAGVRILPAARAVKRALISVLDKTGVVEFARGLSALGFEIVSSSGTAKLLGEAKIPVRAVEELTRFPEILSGRVKTLHPAIHGGVLMRRDDPAHVRQAADFGIDPIDLVCVNLYPFSETVRRAKSPFDAEAIEHIDIGGSALIRAAAKNFEGVAVVVSPEDYAEVLKELGADHGALSLPRRRRLALKAFEHTARYDAAIAGAWKKSEEQERSSGASAGPFPQDLSLSLSKVRDLRYGENPHQRAAVYVRKGESLSFEQLWGKELSYNNLLDAHAAWDCVLDFESPACAIFKHATPCGAAAKGNLLEAFERAWATDPLSAFGGILAFNRAFEASIAEKLANRFVEVVVAPDYEEEALKLLKKKPNLRILKRPPAARSPVQIRAIGPEFLIGDVDGVVFGPDRRVVSRRKPGAVEEQALGFAWTLSKHVRSNAIVLSGLDFAVGIGAGQMSRVDAVFLAGTKYKTWLRDHAAPKPLVLASDAFFPFADGVEAAAGLGISALIQPGGSVKDKDVVAAADKSGLAMVFTNLRHFRH